MVNIFKIFSPGGTATPIFERNGFKGEIADLVREKYFINMSNLQHERWIQKVTPAGRYGETHEMASAMKFLASDEACYITVVCFPVDGGMAIVKITMEQV